VKEKEKCLYRANPKCRTHKRKRAKEPTEDAKSSSNITNRTIKKERKRKQKTHSDFSFSFFLFLFLFLSLSHTKKKTKKTRKVLDRVYLIRNRAYYLFCLFLFEFSTKQREKQREKERKRKRKRERKKMGFCGQCGERLESNSRFCPGCGTKVEGGAPAPAPAASSNPPGMRKIIGKCEMFPSFLCISDILC